MKDAINAVGDRMGLPNGWLNADFRQTASYSPKLAEASVYYRTFPMWCVFAPFRQSTRLP